jgi:hypothetical protein
VLPGYLSQYIYCRFALLFTFPIYLVENIKLYEIFLLE